MNKNFIPSGEVRHVNDTAFDFRCTQLIADQLQMDSRQLDVVAGFDHFFLLYNTNGMFSAAASITSPESGLRLKMFTTQPGVQFYTGNNLSGAFQPRQGLCMEFQKAPDSPNNPGFPSTLLKAGEIYRQHNRLEFEQI